MELSDLQIEPIVALALEEDLGHGDVTTETLISPNVKAQGYLTLRSEGVLAGIDVAEVTFREVDPSLSFERHILDGTRVREGDVIATVTGCAASILKAERTALNFLQRLSAIATETAKYVEAVSGTKAEILHTRKTTPGLRLLERYAVTRGGGHLHRHNLASGVLIKDNHLIASQAGKIGLQEVVQKARQNVPKSMKVEVEVETVEQAQEALNGGADIILLDNMGLDEMRRVVELARGRALTEASGGITLDNVRTVAETGVDFISVGALTHSVRAMDISLDLRGEEGQLSYG